MNSKNKILLNKKFYNKKNRKQLKFTNKKITIL